MKNIFFLVLSVLLLGCGSSASTGDAKDIKDAYSKKEIDYSNVKPEDRERILGMMKANGGAAKAAELEKQWGMSK